LDLLPEDRAHRSPDRFRVIRIRAFFGQERAAYAESVGGAYDCADVARILNAVEQYMRALCHIFVAHCGDNACKKYVLRIFQGGQRIDQAAVRAKHLRVNRDWKRQMCRRQDCFNFRIAHNCFFKQFYAIAKELAAGFPVATAGA
jgi:hypothetical protein